MPTSLLDHLRSRSQVDCDTLHYHAVEALGPFVDCTSNQAISYNELLHPSHASLLTDTALLARTLKASYPLHPPPPTLLAELLQCALAARMIPLTTGLVHVQTDPRTAFSTSSTEACARRIVSYMTTAFSVPQDRVCVKIPATWEGLKAISTLQKENIHCLATAVFTMTQSAMAGEVGASYIAPYVNDLRVHFVPGFVDVSPGFEVCVRAQKWYRARGHATQTMPASLVTVQEAMRLAGAKHITIPPVLLRELAETEMSESVISDFDTTSSSCEEGREYESISSDEARFRFMFNAEQEGVGQIKLTHAINIFCGFQVKLEALALKALNETPE